MESQHQLGSFGTQQTHKTSTEAFNTLDWDKVTGQMGKLLLEYYNHPIGLTDAEMQRTLANRGLRLERARISGRRYDINRRFGQAVIVNVRGETRGGGLVWTINKHIINE